MSRYALPFILTQKSTDGRNQLISIAHRLQTVAYYDRILVMDGGSVAEVKLFFPSQPVGPELMIVQFGSPLSLFDDRDSAFRSLCDTKVSRRRADTLKMRCADT